MLVASGVSAVIYPEAIPALPGVKVLAAHGVESTLAPDNRRVLMGYDGPETALLVVPQTSGGVVLGLPERRVDDCLRAMLDDGLQAAVVGQIEAGDTGSPRIRLE